MKDKPKDMVLGVVALAGHSALLWLAFSSLAHLNAHPTDVPLELWIAIPCFGAVLLGLISALITFTLLKHQVTTQDKSSDTTFALHWTLIAAALSPCMAVAAAFLTSSLLFVVAFVGPIGAVLPYVFIASLVLSANE